MIDPIYQRKQRPIHIAHLANEIGQRCRMRTFEGLSKFAPIPQGNAGASALATSPPLTPIQNLPVGGAEKIPSFNFHLILIIMAVAIYIDLFQDVVLTKTFRNSSKEIKGSCFFFNNALINLERNIVAEVKSEIRKFKTVYSHGKQYADVGGIQKIKTLEEFLKRITFRTKISTLQKKLAQQMELIESMLPSTSAKSYRSQYQKVNFLKEVLGVDLSTVENPGHV